MTNIVLFFVWVLLSGISPKRDAIPADHVFLATAQPMLAIVTESADHADMYLPSSLLPLADAGAQGFAKTSISIRDEDELSIWLIPEASPHHGDVLKFLSLRSCGFAM